MSSFDLFEDGFPHGTAAGYEKGCRGSACPAELEHGLSCRVANTKSHGDYQYQKLVRQGLTPAEIAAAVAVTPVEHVAPKRKTVIPDDDDQPEPPTRKEPIMSTITATPTPADVAPKPTPPKEQPRAHADTIRAWCHEHGIQVGTRGTLPTRIKEAFLAGDPSLAAAPPKRTPKPADETPEPQDATADVEKGTPEPEIETRATLVQLNAEADLEPDLPELPAEAEAPEDTTTYFGDESVAIGAWVPNDYGVAIADWGQPLVDPEKELLGNALEFLIRQHADARDEAAGAHKAVEHLAMRLADVIDTNSMLQRKVARQATQLEVAGARNLRLIAALEVKPQKRWWQR